MSTQEKVDAVRGKINELSKIVEETIESADSKRAISFALSGIALASRGQLICENPT